MWVSVLKLSLLLLKSFMFLLKLLNCADGVGCYGCVVVSVVCVG